MIRSIVLLVSLMATGANGAACTLCALGADPQETQTPRVAQTETTCPMLETQLAGLGAAEDTSDECLNLNLLAYQVGCCSQPPYEFCDVCPDGSDFVRENIVALGTADDPTCAEIQYRPETLVGLFEEGNCADTFLQRGAHYCGCQGVQQECFLCPDGATPGNLDRGEGFAFKSDCRGIMYTFSVFKEDECTNIPATFGFDAAAFCLCPNYEPQYDYECTLCDEGETVGDPNKVWTTATDTFERTCAQADDFAQYFNNEGSCTTLLAPAREACCVTSGSFSFGFIVSLMMAGTLMIKNLLW